MSENWTFAAQTADGVLVEIERTSEGYLVFLDGSEVEIVGRVQVFRDGGTRVFPLAGDLVLTLPHRMNSSDRTPRLAATRNREEER